MRFFRRDDLTVLVVYRFCVDHIFIHVLIVPRVVANDPVVESVEPLGFESFDDVLRHEADVRAGCGVPLRLHGFLEAIDLEVHVRPCLEDGLGYGREVLLQTAVGRDDGRIAQIAVLPLVGRRTQVTAAAEVVVEAIMVVPILAKASIAGIVQTEVNCRLSVALNRQIHRATQVVMPNRISVLIVKAVLNAPQDGCSERTRFVRVFLLEGDSQILAILVRG